MHNLLRLAVLGSLCLGMALSVFADSSNRWGNYRGVERLIKDLHNGAQVRIGLILNILIHSREGLMLSTVTSYLDTMNTVISDR